MTEKTLTTKSNSAQLGHRQNQSDRQTADLFQNDVPTGLSSLTASIVDDERTFPGKSLVESSGRSGSETVAPSEFIRQSMGQHNAEERTQR